MQYVMRILQYFFQQLFVQIGCGRNIARTQAIVLFASAVFYAKLITIVDRDAIGILYTDCVEISFRPGYVKLLVSTCYVFPAIRVLARVLLFSE